MASDPIVGATPTDDTGGHHPVGHRRSAGQRVGPTTREPDDLHLVDPERVGDGAQVVGEREHRVVLIGRRRPDAGPVDSDQPDLPLLGVDAGLHRDLPARSRRSVQPEHGAALRIAELGKSDLTVIADGDVAFQLGTGDCDSHAQSVSFGRTEQVRAHRRDAVVDSFVVHDGADGEHAVGPGHRFGFDTERTDLAAGNEHHV
jgi:hypothetical protein